VTDWSSWNYDQMFTVLGKAVAKGRQFVCPGCGKLIEPHYFALDHEVSSHQNGSDKVINRMPLCIPCNTLKGHKLTLEELRAKNNENGRMADEETAKQAEKSVRATHEQIKNDFMNPELQRLASFRNKHKSGWLPPEGPGAHHDPSQK